MLEHWIIRIGNGNHFISSSKFNIWGINSKDKCNTNKFINEAQEGDILWFVTSNSKGKAISVSTFKEMKNREIVYYQNVKIAMFILIYLAPCKITDIA